MVWGIPWIGGPLSIGLVRRLHEVEKSDRAVERLGQGDGPPNGHIRKLRAIDAHEDATQAPLGGPLISTLYGAARPWREKTVWFRSEPWAPRRLSPRTATDGPDRIRAGMRNASAPIHGSSSVNALRQNGHPGLQDAHDSVPRQGRLRVDRRRLLTRGHVGRDRPLGAGSHRRGRRGRPRGAVLGVAPDRRRGGRRGRRRPVARGARVALPTGQPRTPAGSHRDRRDHAGVQRAVGLRGVACRALVRRSS